ncbi:MAG: Tol-Pal system beta propeller repeat protein TolB, partial [Saezia sp.]
DEKTPIVNSEWRDLGADALLSGSIKKLDNGKFEVYFRLWDVATNKELINEGYTVSAGDLRLAAHHISDVVFEKMTGFPGAFASQIAFVSNQGGKHTLYVADSDGERAKAIYTSTQSIISPAWSADGSKLAYVSFEQNKPVIYVQTLATGQRSAVANYKGSNSAPAWAPNGGMLASLTLSGLSQIYALDAGGGAPKRLTRTTGIDTQPRFSSDGQFIYFVSDRGGNPQIYRMPASGGDAGRVTFNSNYSVDPAVSADGKWLAYVGQDQGRFGLQLQNLATSQVQRLTDTSADATPSFAPNSLLIMYSTQIGGKNTLMTTTLDGQVRMPLAISNAKEVVWGPRIL